MMTSSFLSSPDAMTTSDPPSAPPPLPPHTFHVLLVLSRSPAHGYGIKKAVLDESAGGVDLDPGGLYRLIARMEEQGWVEPAPAPESETDARRKYYALTSRGRQALATEAARLTRLAGASEVKALAREGFTG
jgi:DNA-binding PadR family transcriptional regulator